MTQHIPILTPAPDQTIGGYGVSCIDEDGSMLIVGHPSLLRAAAILVVYGKRWSSFARDDYGFHRPIVEDDLDIIEHTWAVFTRHHRECPSTAAEPSRDTCEGHDCFDYGWFVRWVDEGTPGAVPVTVFES